MLRKSVTLVLAAMALALFMSQSLKAEDKSHEGVVVNAGGGKLTMTMQDGSRKHTHEVPATAKVTIDGKPAKLEDVKEHFHVKVTTDDKNVVKSIDAHSRK